MLYEFDGREHLPEEYNFDDSEFLKEEPVKVVVEEYNFSEVELLEETVEEVVVIKPVVIKRPDIIRKIVEAKPKPILIKDEPIEEKIVDPVERFTTAISGMNFKKPEVVKEEDENLSVLEKIKKLERQAVRSNDGIQKQILDLMSEVAGQTSGGELNNIFIQNETPNTFHNKYLWIQTGLGADETDCTIWIEDGT